MSKKNKILGILWSDQKIVVSQLERSGKTFSLSKCNEYLLPDDKTHDQFCKDPSDFVGFLKDNGFKCDKAVIGLSGKHAVGTELQIPPLKDISMLPGVLRFNLEKRTMLQSEETLIDFSGKPGPAACQLFVVSVLKTKADAIKSVLQAARIKPVSLTLSVLAADVSDGNGLTCGIVVDSNSAEIVIVHNSVIKNMRYVPLPVADQTDMTVARKIAGEFKRLVIDEIASQIPISIQLVNTSDHTSIRQALADAGSNIDFVESDQQIDYGQSSPPCHLAADLARKYLSDDKFQIDLLNSHINDKKESRLRSILPRAIAVAAIILLGIGYLVLDWRADTDAVALYEEKLELIEGQVDQAKKVIGRVGYARKWFDATPRYIESLKELTLLFPEQGDVWINSLAIDEAFNQVITGKAIEERAVLDVLDKLEQSDYFKNVKMLYIRQTAKNSAVVSFAINFQFGQG